MKWTEERVTRLRKLWAEGKTCSECARDLGGVTRNAIIGKVHRLGLELRHGPVVPTRRQQKQIRRKIRRKRLGLELDLAPIPRRKIKASFGIKTASVPQPVTAYVEPPITETIGVKNIEDLTSQHCRWPIGDPRQPGFGYCGCQPVTGLPYCEPHAQRAYNSVAVAVRVVAKAPERAKEYA